MPTVCPLIAADVDWNALANPVGNAVTVVVIMTVSVVDIFVKDDVALVDCIVGSDVSDLIV
jgi:hypothetical protein